MNICLIGPVYPYKGGIAHYTALLYKELAKKHHVTMISYSLQYPKFLYKKEQRDYSNTSFKIEGTRFLIHTANPINWIRTAYKLRKMDADLIVWQWWHPYFSPCYYAMGKILKNKKHLFICHNVFPHERFPMDRFLSKQVLKQGDYFVVQSNLDKKDLLDVNPYAKYIVTPHPTYNVFKMQDMSRSHARKILNISNDVPVILFFGFVREYKGLKYLIKALPYVCEKIKNIELWVVGDFGEDKEDYIKLVDENKVRENIKIVEGYVPDKDVEKYFAATDLVVLPYISATQSGIVQIAYGFEKPVIVTDVGGLPDVVDDGKTGYVVEKENEVAIANAIIRFWSDNAGADMRINIQKKADEFSWETMRHRIENLINS